MKKLVYSREMQIHITPSNYMYFYIFFHASILLKFPEEIKKSNCLRHLKVVISVCIKITGYKAVAEWSCSANTLSVK